MLTAMLAMLAGVTAFSPHAAPPRHALAVVHAARVYTPPAMDARILTEENAVAVIAECMDELGTMFGTNAESARVGITGEVEFVELDGPCIVVRLKGRFWHQRSRVVERVESYVLERIPECVEVVVEDAAQLDDADPDELETALDKAFNDEPPVQFGNQV